MGRLSRATHSSRQVDRRRQDRHPDEAARRIRDEDVRGFYVYAGRDDHDTDGLLITDEDEPDEWPDVQETLTIVSGSGEVQHRYWEDDGWERGENRKDAWRGKMTSLPRSKKTVSTVLMVLTINQMNTMKT